MNNMPELKIGVVAVSRDCFPESLSVSRREALMKAYKEKYGDADIYECPICIVESEIHMVQALEDIKKAGCNALVVYLGNFGPEISETLLAKHFDGPKMFVAAAEERGDNLVHNNVKRYARNGSIITFHDSLKSWNNGNLQYALPRSIEFLKAEGYEFKVL